MITEITFECLGHWQGLGNKKYVALMNVQAHDKLGPQYRCAVYVEHPTTGIIVISFSNDSTCAAVNAYSSTNNAGQTHSEILELYPVTKSQWSHNIFCSYPDWSIGHWKHIIVDQSTIVYQDHSSFKTYTMKCIENEVGSEKFIVFGRTQW